MAGKRYPLQSEGLFLCVVEYSTGNKRKLPFNCHHVRISFSAERNDLAHNSSIRCFPVLGRQSSCLFRPCGMSRRSIEKVVILADHSLHPSLMHGHLLLFSPRFHATSDLSERFHG